jgi:2-desacetyl-2-hydroxyethyl bacteriochlorophyllide A dehydrogenase
LTAEAVVATAPREIEFRTVAVPEPGSDDVVVRLTHSWISNGTEGSFVRGERIAGDAPWRAGDPLPFPHVPGYQKVGVVERVGTNVDHVAPGDSVFVSVSKVDGMFFDFAGHVSPTVAHRSQVWKLPAGLDPLAASGLVLLQVGWNVGMRPPVSDGDAAVVVGDGLVGHWAAQTLRARGARVMLLGRRAERLERFRQRPEDATLNVREADVAYAVRAWAPEGIGILAHTSGATGFIESLFPCLKRFGQVVSAGFVGKEGSIDVQRMRDQELSLHAVSGWTGRRMDESLRWLSDGRLETLPLITHRFPATRAADAFDLILNNREPHLGVVLDWETQA